MKNTFIFVVLFIAIAGLLSLTMKITNTVTKNNHPVACSMEAKLCPDGSYVSRTGPDCQFSACPTATSTSATSL